MEKELLFSIFLKKDCEVKYCRGSGKGGQKRNKTSNVVQIKHAPSGVTVRSEKYREQSKNRTDAFIKLYESEEMQKWLDLEARRIMGLLKDDDIKIEIRENGKWVEVKNL